MIPCRDCGTALRVTFTDRAQLAREHLDAYCTDCHVRNEHGA
jgi:hypothetical protein